MNNMLQITHEIIARRKQYPVAFVGLGGLEWHSEHLAVGLDALKAEALCDLAAQRSGGFAFPPLWYGEPRVTRIMHRADGELVARGENDIRRAVLFEQSRRMVVSNIFIGIFTDGSLQLRASVRRAHVIYECEQGLQAILAIDIDSPGNRRHIIPDKPLPTIYDGM